MIRISPYLCISIWLVTHGRLHAQFDSDIHAWVTQDERNPPVEDSVLFNGHSSIRVWESLASDFADYNVIQRGFGSAQLSDVERNVDNIILPYDPAAVVMYSIPPDVDEARMQQDYLDVITLIHSKQRQDRGPIPIFFVGMFPPTSLSTRYQRRKTVLKRIATDNDAVYFIDTAARMLEGAPGRPPAEQLYASDGRHLSAEGYEYWHVPIREAVESILAPNKVFELNTDRPMEDDRILIDFGRVATDSPDINGNHWNSWHTDTSTSILAGQSLGNSITTEGRETGVDLITTGEFDTVDSSSSGLREPSPELLGEFAIASATRDAFIRGSAAASLGVPTAGFMLNGLDPESGYDVRFFGTRRSSRDRIARYSIVGMGEPVVKDFLLATSENGQNTDTILEFSDIRPDRFGQIFVDLQPVDGRHDGYLNIMELSMTSRQLAGDFDDDNLLTAADIDILANAIRDGSDDTQFDLNDDASVGQGDHRHWVTELKQTWFGDSNLEGEFNSGDLVQVFQAGHYEDDIAMNSGWSEGDWNGDGDFDSGDLVKAFQDGGFEQGPRGAVAVPEPSASAWLVASTAALVLFRR